MRTTIEVIERIPKTSKAGNPYFEYVTNIGKATCFKEQDAALKTYGFNSPVDVEWQIGEIYTNITKVYGEPEVGVTTETVIPPKPTAIENLANAKPMPVPPPAKPTNMDDKIMFLSAWRGVCDANQEQMPVEVLIQTTLIAYKLLKEVQL